MQQAAQCQPCQNAKVLHSEKITQSWQKLTSHNMIPQDMKPPPKQDQEMNY